MRCISPNFSCLKRRHMMDAGFLSSLVSQQKNLGVFKTTHLKDRLNPYLEVPPSIQKKGSSYRWEFSEYWSCLRCILLYRECYPFCAVSKAEVKWTKLLTNHRKLIFTFPHLSSGLSKGCRFLNSAWLTSYDFQNLFWRTNKQTNKPKILLFQLKK